MPKSGRRQARGSSGQNDGPEESAKDNHFSWRKFLSANPKHEIIPVPVWAFHHAPLYNVWDQLEDVIGLKIEYKLGKGKGDFEKFGEVYWIGALDEYFGYMVKIQVEGYPSNLERGVPTRWLNYLTDCFRIGHCSNIEDSSIIPPFEIWHMQKDWRSFVTGAISKSVTIPRRISEQIESELNGTFEVGSKVEALDNNYVSRMKVGQIEKNVGKRLYIRYWDAKEKESSTEGIWCHETSEFVKPPGWSKTVGHQISSPQNYNPKIIPEDLIGKENPGVDIQVGMKLEAVDPINPSIICAATVVKVLKFGYMMVSFDEIEPGSPPPVLHAHSSIIVSDKTSPPVLEVQVSHNAEASETDKDKDKNNEAIKDVESGHGNDMMCFHITSPLIFNCGFCKNNGLNLIPPKEYKDKDEPFNWTDYFSNTGSIPLQIKDLDPLDLSIVTKGFSKGSKLEAVDLIDSSLICLATVIDAKERLLKIGFDGWPDEYEQWMYAKSPDLYPIGWCDAYNYPLTGPPNETDFWKKYARPDASAVIESGTFEATDEYQFNAIQAGDRDKTQDCTEEPKSLVKETQKSRKRKAAELLLLSVDDKFKKEESSHKRRNKGQILQGEHDKGRAQKRKSKTQVFQVDHDKVKEEAVMLGRKIKPVPKAVLEKVKKQAESLGLKPKTSGEF